MSLGLVSILAVSSLISLHILAHGALLNINRGVDRGADIVTEKRKCTASWSEPWLHSYTWQTSISSANRAVVKIKSIVEETLLAEYVTVPHGKRL